jgi:hypothetical protein
MTYRYATSRNKVLRTGGRRPPLRMKTGRVVEQGRGLQIVSLCKIL